MLQASTLLTSNNVTSGTSDGKQDFTDGDSIKLA